jgi:hypothetical protein
VPCVTSPGSSGSRFGEAVREVPPACPVQPDRGPYQATRFGNCWQVVGEAGVASLVDTTPIFRHAQTRLPSRVRGASVGLRFREQLRELEGVLAAIDEDYASS